MELAVIENEALKLSHTDRALLADRLLATLDTPGDGTLQAWVEEGERRLTRFRKGEIVAMDGQTALASLREQFG